MTQHHKGQSQDCEQKVFITGMTCVSCETIIREELKALPEVETVHVSQKTGQADVRFKQADADTSSVLKTIERLGYKASLSSKGPAPDKAIVWSEWFSAVMIVVALYLLYRTFSGWGLFDWVSADMTQVSYGVAFLIGIVASMSTCLAVVGAVIISFAAKYQVKGTYYQSNIRPHVLFQAGRMGSFFILGGFLGLIGTWFQMSGSFAAVLSIAIAVVLIWLGLNVLGIVPYLSTLGIHLPKSIMKSWGRLKDSEHPLAPILLGGLTFFLPCGFTQSMQIFAIASGSMMTGALTMFFFALGTAPILTGIGIATTRFSGARSGIFKKAVGLIIILFSFYTLSSGLAQYGISLDVFSQSDAKAATTVNNMQTIKMTVDYSGFSPNVFTITKGVPVRWVIDGKQVTGCTNQIIVPDLNIQKKIVSGQNVVEFTPTKVGTINFSCWMGMVRGKFIVVDQSADAGPSIIQAANAEAVTDTSLTGSCGGNGSCGGTGSCGGGCGGGCGADLS